MQDFVSSRTPVAWAPRGRGWRTAPSAKYVVTPGWRLRLPRRFHLEGTHMDKATHPAPPWHQSELAFLDRHVDESPPTPTQPTGTCFLHGQATVHLADCFAWLRACPPRSIQAVVTDPPYGVHEFQAVQIQKLRHGGGGVWRSPPQMNGHRRAAVPRFTVLTATDHRALCLFYEKLARLLAACRT